MNTLFNLKPSFLKPRYPFHPLEYYQAFKKLADQYSIILKELKKNSYWMNWGSDYRDPTGHCKFLHGEWTICPVYFGNYGITMMNVPDMDLDSICKLAIELPKMFPETTELLKGIKEVNFAAFSRLHPKSKLEAHHHNNYHSLIFHLGLIIPPGSTCGLSVDNKIHLWTKPGDAVIFDDTFEHSAWNDSDEERVIFYVDFSRPGDREK